MSAALYRWAALILGQSVILTGLILTYLATRTTRTKVDDVDSKVNSVDTKVDVAAVEARRAAKAVEPISNGFAGHTTEALDGLHQAIGECRTLLIQHIADHASSDVRRHN